MSNEEDQMSRGFPSMTALLGLLAIAGYLAGALVYIAQYQLLG